jgi:hypothetical protein
MPMPSNGAWGSAYGTNNNYVNFDTATTSTNFLYESQAQRDDKIIKELNDYIIKELNRNIENIALYVKIEKMRKQGIIRQSLYEYIYHQLGKEIPEKIIWPKED